LLDSPAPFFLGRQVKRIRQKKREKNTPTHQFSRRGQTVKFSNLTDQFWSVQHASEPKTGSSAKREAERKYKAGWVKLSELLGRLVFPSSRVALYLQDRSGKAANIKRRVLPSTQEFVGALSRWLPTSWASVRGASSAFLVNPALCCLL
jgi:hypothetical protein